MTRIFSSRSSICSNRRRHSSHNCTSAASTATTSLMTCVTDREDLMLSFLQGEQELSFIVSWILWIK